MTVTLMLLAGDALLAALSIVAAFVIRFQWGSGKNGLMTIR